MEITILEELLMAVFVAAIIGAIVGLIVRRGNDAKVGIGCGLMFPITLAVFIILQKVIPDVTVITDSNGYLSYDTKAMISSIKFSAGQSVRLPLCGNYIANYSNETLIYYPVYYGLENKTNSVKEEDPIIIPPNYVVCIKRIPDYYFSPAAPHISSKSDNVEVRWVLETFRSVAERERLENLKNDLK